MKIGSRASIGCMIVKVEVAVQGNNKKIDVISNVNSRIGYLEIPELLKSPLSRAEVQMQMSYVLSVLRARPLGRNQKRVKSYRPKAEDADAKIEG